MTEIYEFGNGLRVCRSHLMDKQLERYALPGNANLHEPVEEGWIVKLLDLIDTDSPVFLDVGAGIGYYAILVKKLRAQARVYAVEPLPRHLDACTQNLALNGFSSTDVSLIAAAVADVPGRAALIDRGYGSYVDTASAQETDHIDVLALTLSDLTARAGGDVHLVKMDIQGRELAVLNASSDCLASGSIGYLVVGTHTAEIHRQVHGVLAAHGKVLYDDPAPQFQPDGLIVADLRHA